MFSHCLATCDESCTSYSVKTYTFLNKAKQLNEEEEDSTAHERSGD
jgi:hypothetical protein